MAKISAVGRLLQHLIVKRVFLVIAAAVLIVFIVQMYGRAYRGEGYDFTSYLLSSHALVHGTNPYDTGSPFQFIYPLFLPVLLAPLSVTPYWLSNLLWFILNAGAMVCAIAFVVSTDHSSPMFSWLSVRNNYFGIVIVIFFIFLNTIQNNLLNGQVNFIVVYCCCAFFYFLINEKHLWAASCLSAAISIKVSPLLFIVFLLLERKYSVLMMTLLFTIIMMFGLPYLFAGNVLSTYYREYANSFLLKSLEHSSGAQEGEMFLSLSGFIRYLSPSTYNITGVRTLCMAVVTIMCMLIHRKYVRSGILASVLIFLLYMMSILLITPMSETHHLAYLVIPVMTLVVFAATGRTKKDTTSKFALLAFSSLYLLGSRFEGQPFYFFSIVSAVFYLIKVLNDITPNAIPGMNK